MYYPALSIMASKAVYNNAAYNDAIVDGHWEMQSLGLKDYWNDFLLKAYTQALLFRDKSDGHDTFVVCFRGTQPFNARDWCSDIDLFWYEFPNIGKIHSGFLKALGMPKAGGWPKVVVPDLTRIAPLAYYDIRDKLKDLMTENPQAKFIVTGHSLGGALAILFPAILIYHEETLLLQRMEGVVPFDINGHWFTHFGTCVYYNSKYEAKIVEEVPYKNYFSIWAFFTMLKNAIYEIIRSFTIAKTYGADHKEGWVLFFVRVIGLLIPGIPNHFPQDYVNSTRLGSPDEVLSLPLYKKKTIQEEEVRFLVHCAGDTTQKMHESGEAAEDEDEILQNQERRYPRRERKAPEYLKDFVI
ncbi:hypothetical protein PTKIN_Ptkin08bG0108700 [Pterospermum kingtungense]